MLEMCWMNKKNPCNLFNYKDLLMHFVQKAGVEPARVLSPLDFESSASASSATSANN